MAQAGLDEVGGDRGLHRGRVRADGDGGTARAQKRTQAFEQVYRAEVVDGGQERAGPAGQAGQPGTGHDARQLTAASFGRTLDGAATPLGGGQIGDDVRRVLVDADDVPARSAESRRGGGADA
jgi:hypothetical protein